MKNHKHHHRCDLPALVLIGASLAILGCSASDTTGPGDVGADRTPPPAVTDLVITYPTAGGSAHLSWTAPTNDGDPVDRYELRYAYSSPFTWELALPVSDPPEPSAPGALENYDFQSPRRGRDLYAAIRSFDAANNASPLSDVTVVHIVGLVYDGHCVDVMTGSDVEGLSVQVTDRWARRTVTDDRGRFRLDDIAAGLVHLDVRHGASQTPYHDYRLTLDLSEDVALEHLMIPSSPTELLAGRTVLSLLLQAVALHNYQSLLNKWQAFPVEVFVPPFVNDNEVDYGDVCRQAVDIWNARVGLPLFRLVGSQPSTGVWFRFRTRQDMAPHIGITHHENDAEGFPQSSDISMVNDFPGADHVLEVALHELGHGLRFGHLPAGYLMYAGQPLPATVTDDEVNMTRLYMALPNRTDLTVYDPDPPE